jgi:uncharacterized protein
MNKQIVTGIYEAFGRSDLAGVLSALADDVAWDMPGSVPYSGARKGHAQVQQFFMDLLGAVKIDQFEVKVVTGDGDHVVVLGHERCTVHATGKSFEQDWAHAYTLRDGKVIAVKLFEDTAAQTAAFAH